MSQINIQYHSTPCGELVLGSYEGRLCLCDWRYRAMRSRIDGKLVRHLKANLVEVCDEVLMQACHELEEYFLGERRAFEVELLVLGTNFQLMVWEGLRGLAYGETTSYTELATRVGRARAARAVANACGANALSLFVPCHRVLGANGTLSGYAGGVSTKEKLLKLEGVKEALILQ